MNSLLRIALSSAALAVALAAQADVRLYYADAATGLPLATLPLTSTSTTIAVYYTSTTPISDSEVFASYDRSTAQGTGATPIDGFVSLAAPTAAAGVDLNGVTSAGGYGAAGAARPYGLDVLSVSASSGNLPATTTGARLFTVTLNALALAPGASATLGFNTAIAPTYTSNFYDDGSNQVAVTGSSLVVTRAQATPEPSALAALGLGAVGLLRRRRKA